MGDHVHADALSPDFQLLDGRRAERVRRRQDDLLVLRLVDTGSSLAMLVVLPEPLTPTTRMTTGGWCWRVEAWLALACEFRIASNSSFRNSSTCVASRTCSFSARTRRLVHQRESRFHANVRADQHFLKP